MTVELYLGDSTWSRMGDALGHMRRNLKSGADLDVELADVNEMIRRTNEVTDGDGRALHVDADDLHVLWTAASELKFDFRGTPIEVGELQRIESALADADRKLNGEV